MMKYSAQTIRLPAQYALLAPEEQAAVAGGAGFADVLNNISKISKVFNYMARFSLPPAPCSTILSQPITPCRI